MIFIRADGTIARIAANTVPLVAGPGAVGRAGRGGARDRAAAAPPSSASSAGDRVELARTDGLRSPRRRRGKGACSWDFWPTHSPGGTAPRGAPHRSRAATARRSAATRPATSISSIEGPGPPLGDLRRRQRRQPGAARLAAVAARARSTTCPTRRCRRSASSREAPTANLTGTMAAFRPDGALGSGRIRPASTGDYEPWMPE